MRRLFFIAVFAFHSLFLFQQEKLVFSFDSIPSYNPVTRNTYGLEFPASWKYHKGDDLKWADSSFNDRSWALTETNLPFKKAGEQVFDSIGWFRIWVKPGPALRNITLALMIDHDGASEIYLDGKKLEAFGRIDRETPAHEERYSPKFIPVGIRFEGESAHLIAVRYANARALHNYKKHLSDLGGFIMKLGDLRTSTFFSFINSNILTTIFIFYFTFFLALSFLHFMFFLFYPSNKSNLYYSIFAGAFGSTFLVITLNNAYLDPDFVLNIGAYGQYLSELYSIGLLAMLYTIFYGRFTRLCWFWFCLYAGGALLKIVDVEVPYINYVLNTILVVESLRLIIVAIVKKREGAWIIGSGIISTIAFFLLFFVLTAIGRVNFSSQGIMGLIYGILTIYATLSIPISMTVYLARDFAKTSKNLEKKLAEVETLSAKSLEQEKEKQKILETQKEVLEHKVTERTREISEQKKVIEEKNKDITDSILYAKRIQEAMLPPLDLLYNCLPQSFVLYLPKDIVAGDFYWAHVVSSELRVESVESGDKSNSPLRYSQPPSLNSQLTLIAAADCTGHGVPGAMVSVVCANALNRSVKEFGITEPGNILDKVRDLVLETFEKSQAEVKDGMDISLCSVLRSPGSDHITVKWSGANNPLWYLKGGQLNEITAHKQPIGKTDNPSPFPTHALELSKGDSLFLFTDGYADQFGGARGKKFKYKQLQELLVSNYQLPAEQFRDKLLDIFTEWKGSLEQIDDVTIIGIRL